MFFFTFRGEDLKIFDEIFVEIEISGTRISGAGHGVTLGITSAVGITCWVKRRPRSSSVSRKNKNINELKYYH